MPPTKSGLFSRDDHQPPTERALRNTVVHDDLTSEVYSIVVALATQARWQE